MWRETQVDTRDNLETTKDSRMIGRILQPLPKLERKKGN